jgi:signal transduction histidine kinase
MESLYSPQSRAERLIAVGRVVLAVSSLLAVWLDPTEPTKYAEIAYSLLVFYLLYSSLIAAVVLRSDPPPNRQRLFTQVFDLIFFSLFIYFTAGPASPFLIYFVFSLVCATLRWQRRGVLWTTLASLAVLLSIGLYFSTVVGDPSFRLYPLVIRGIYLAVIAVLLGYLGAHEEQTRREMSRLAAWPEEDPAQLEPLVQGLLEHANRAVGAPRALLAWVEREEPWLYLGLWDGQVFSWSRASPGTFGDLVAEPLQGAGFLCLDAAGPQPEVLCKSAEGLRRWRGRPLDPSLRERYEMRAVLALRVAAESLEGRLFFLDKKSMTSDDLVLGEIVADAVARRLDRFYLSQQIQETVATEERIRLARDLHDGVLQSLTGVGLRLAAIRGQLEENPAAAREGLDSLQRLISLEQRDLRFFIRELKPPPLTPPGEAQSLPFRVADLLQRIELEWGLKVDLRTEGLEEPSPEPLAREVYHVIREALVNAVRHGDASEVRVEILRHGRDRLRITVVDNGRGFPFQGRLTHRELAEGDLGPRNLLERVTSLDGTLTLESSGAGARLDIALPWAGA